MSTNSYYSAAKLEKLKKLQSYPDFKTKTLPFLKAYFEKCIPQKKPGAFWCITAMPSGSNKQHFNEIFKGKSIFNYRVVTRVSLSMCEVLTIGIERENNRSNYSFHIKKEGITESYLKKIQKKIQTLHYSNHYYPSVNIHQHTIWVSTFDDAIKLIEEISIVNAIKEFNSLQMQNKGKKYERFHNKYLTDLIFA